MNRVVALSAGILASLAFAGVSPEALSQGHGSSEREGSLLAQSKQPKDVDSQLQLVSSSSTTGKVSIGSASQSASGKVNLVVLATPEMIRKGKLSVQNLTILMSEVRQTDRKGRPIKGNVAFSSVGSGQLTYDPKKRSLTGNLSGEVETSALSLGKPRQMDSKYHDFYDLPVQAANAKIVVDLKDGLPVKLPADGRMKINGKIRYQISAKQDPSIGAPAITFFGSSSWWAWWFFRNRYEIVRELCVQPVRIKSSATDANPTGAGLAFGMPGAREQWRKTDVVFGVRSWKEFVDPDLKVATALDSGTSAEESEIMGKVNDSDCIEMFFVENFSPVDGHGGGAAWGLGRANSKIITSDGNDNGIDFTHLAHELGHVMGLGHPWDVTTPANTGTLMCGSGWRRDNPTLNSLGNQELLSNPLFTLTVRSKSRRGPDCTDNADCGRCP